MGDVPDTQIVEGDTRKAQYIVTPCAVQRCPAAGCFQVLETVLAMLMPDFITDPKFFKFQKFINE